MRVEEQYEATLKDLESALVPLYRADPDLNDYATMRALEAAIGHYKAVSRGQTPRPSGLAGADLRLFEALQGVCADWMAPAAADTGEAPPLKADELVLILKRLLKSVQFWNADGGRRGYYEYVKRWLPEV